MNRPMSDPSGTPKSGKWAALRLVLGLAAFPMAFLSFIIGVAAVPGTPDSYLMNVFPVFLFVLPAILVLSGIGCLLPIRSLNRVALPLAALAIAATLAPAALAFGLAALDGVIN